MRGVKSQEELNAYQKKARKAGKKALKVLLISLGIAFIIVFGALILL
jgi:hypothetical protein